MRKWVTFVLALAMAIAVSAALLANQQVLNFTSNGKKVHFAMKDGKKVNSCNYCHVTAKIEKKHQGFLKGQPMFKSLATKPFCSGKGCHI